jgi:hypothetical protein
VVDFNISVRSRYAGNDTLQVILIQLLEQSSARDVVRMDMSIHHIFQIQVQILDKLSISLCQIYDGINEESFFGGGVSKEVRVSRTLFVEELIKNSNILNRFTKLVQKIITSIREKTNLAKNIRPSGHSRARHFSD